MNIMHIKITTPGPKSWCAEFEIENGSYAKKLLNLLNTGVKISILGKVIATEYDKEI